MIRLRAIPVSVACALLIAAPLSAQKKGQGRPGRAALVRDIEQMFLNQATREMAITDEQLPRFQRVVVSWARKREALETEERTLRQSLQSELRPGVAANADSVARFVDALNSNRVAYAETFRDEMRELTPILTPVQRGQFQMARDRLLQRVRELQQQRAGGAARPALNPEP